MRTHFLVYCQIFTMEDDIVGLFIDVELDRDLSWKIDMTRYFPLFSLFETKRTKNTWNIAEIVY